MILRLALAAWAVSLSLSLSLSPAQTVGDPDAAMERGAGLFLETRLSDARAEFGDAAAWFAEAGRPVDAAWARTCRALTLRADGRHAEALLDLDAAIGGLTDGEDPRRDDFLLQTRLVRASCLRALGDAEGALRATVEVATAHGATVQDDVGSWLMLERELAACRYDVGDWDRAAAGIAGVRQRAVDVGLDIPAIGELAVTEGACLLQLGRPDDAERALSRGLELLVAHSPDLDGRTAIEDAAATALLNRSAARRMLGKLDLASADLDRALSIVRRLFGNDPHPRSAALLLERASVRRAAGQLDGALADYRTVAAEWQSLHPDGHLEVARADLHIARTLEARGELATALGYARRGVELGRRFDHRDQFAWEADLARLVLDSGGDAGDALTGFERAIALLEEEAGRVRALDLAERNRFLARLDREEVYEDAFRAALRAGKAAIAVDLLERGRARGLADLLAARSLDPLATVRATAAAARDSALLERANRAEAALTDARADAARRSFELAALWSRGDLGRDEQRAQARALEAAVAAARRGIGAAARARDTLVRDHLPAGQPHRALELLATAPRGVHVLIYAVTSRGSWLCHGRAGERDFEVAELRWPDGKAVTDGALRAAIETFVGALARSSGPERGRSVDGGDTRPVDTIALGHRLFDALVPAGAVRELGPDDVALVVPHGALHRLPFQALVPAHADGSAPRRWLDSGPALAYAPSASVALWCLEHGARRPDPATGPVVAVGDPNYGSAQSGGGLAPLPHTRREVLAIRDALGPGRVVPLLGDAARESRIRELAASASILHFATHQVLDPTGGGLQSRLALSVPTAVSGDDDGFLSLADLLESWRGRLDGCELVVLSACDTQRGTLDGDAVRSQGVLALPWGFHFAGCPRVLATLWRVDDESTADLMTAFYRRLAARGDDPCARLRAFTTALREFAAKRPSPHGWAPFVWLGDPR